MNLSIDSQKGFLPQPNEYTIEPISELLKYRNLAVVKRFQKDFPDKAHLAETLFDDLLRFFWGTKKHSMDKQRDSHNSALNFVYIMDEEMRDIDQMWHIFLLYTRDYMSFCEKHFGQYLHHQPDLVPLFETSGYNYAENLERFLNYTYDILGEDVVKRWFAQSI